MSSAGKAVVARPGKTSAKARGKRDTRGSMRTGPRTAPSAEPRTRRTTDERRAQLVALGFEHFGTRAYDDVSIDEIAAAAGISKGLLYHYFPTKRAFYAAVIGEAAASLVEACDAVTPGTPEEQLRAAIDTYLTYVRAHARAYATLLRSGVGVDPEIARIVDHTRASFTERLIAGFRDVPLGGLAIPLEAPIVQVALRGWIGFAEASSLGWTEAIAAARPAPTQAELGDLLASSLVSAIQHAVRAALTSA